MKMKMLLASAALAGVLGAAGAASATVTVWNFSGAVADGNGDATATISTAVNSLTVALTNNQVNPISDGREISGISITLSGVPTALSLFSSSGTLINIAKKTGAVTPSADAIDHWGTGVNGGGVIFLDAVGPFAPGGTPHDLIIGLGPYTNANGSITGVHNPHIQGTGTFVLNFTLPAAYTVTGVNIAFGTTGEDFHGATCTTGCTREPPPPVPEPATWAMMIMGFGGVGAMMRRRRTVFG